MRIKLIIFAKAPIPGAVKTRLIPALGPCGAASVAARLLKNTVRTACQTQVDAVELCVAPSIDSPVWQNFNEHDLTLSVPIAWSTQGAGDLGERLSRAVRRATDSGYAVLVIGTDCPALTVEKLNEAAALLRVTPAVMIPALDGGYVLLGLQVHHPMIFHGIAWSTSSVAQETQKRLCMLDFSCHVLEALSDLDVPEDLLRYPEFCDM